MVNKELLMKELQFAYIHASGPGGQNVNKVATSVQLRFGVMGSKVLDEETKQRLSKLARTRISSDGTLVIEAKRYRSQEKNREDAVNRLCSLIDKAETPPAVRKPTRPSAAEKMGRREAKTHQAVKKQNRKLPGDWQD